MTPTILLIGASVRAAAWSARRSGFHVVAIDLFADLDLRALSETHRVVDFPRGIGPIAAGLPPMDWLFTGGLENHPRWVEAISRRHRLWGNGSATLRRVRDPWELAAAFAESDIAFPRMRRAPPSCAQWREGSTRWIRKPRTSCGGRDVTLIELPELTNSSLPGFDAVDPRRASCHNYIFQEFIAGLSCSAIFLSNGIAARLLAATEQITGDVSGLWAGNKTDDTSVLDFRYGGSLGPLALTDTEWAQFERVGDCLVEHFGLVGLFGVDAVLADGRVWPIEVNPRYTASIEVIERACGLLSVALHRSACRDGELGSTTSGQPDRIVGKAVVYADRDVVVGNDFVDHCASQNAAAEWPMLADIPAARERIPRSAPLVTVFAEGRTRDEVRRQLAIDAAKVRARIAQSGSGF
jgi:predicted ATP-grasp superfamily ATP-dependent carboligase